MAESFKKRRGNWNLPKSLSSKWYTSCTLLSILGVAPLRCPYVRRCKDTKTIYTCQ